MTSTIKVDNLQKVSDASNIIKKCGTTTTIGSGGSNPIVVDGSAVTLGRCGGTVALASGATQTGFGRTGTVDWQTDSIKTSTFTATSGEGYFVNTTGGGVTVNLPAGVAGAIVGLKDYAGTWDSNAVTLNPNGSDKIGGGADVDPTLESKGGALLLVFVDSTQGWLTTAESVTESPSGIENFITATGGTITTVCTNYKVHTFTGPGTFCVSQIATCAANNAVAYMVVAGGGGNGNAGGGGGAGGFREGTTAPIVPFTASPLVNSSGITVSATSYPITVGAGGAARGGPGGVNGLNGSNSIFSTITSAGGGYGGGRPNPGGPGGSGGGGGDYAPSATGGSGNTPPVSPPQGNNGGAGSSGENGGGGGGATGSGGGGNGNPGAGACTQITGSAVTYSGGGAGDGGGSGPPTPRANTGGGSANADEGAGSGIVVIRYKFQ